MKKKKKLIIICIIIITVIIFLIITGIFGFARTASYTVSEGECNSIITTYSADGKPSTLNDKGECKIAGYYIDNNRVNINIGNINCDHKIKIKKIKISKDMNVYIKVKESYFIFADKLGLDASCNCSKSLNITFSKKVNNVTIVNENGAKLHKCA